MTRRRATSLWNRSARRRHKPAAGEAFCRAGAADAGRVLWFGHDPFGKPASTFPDHAAKAALFLANRSRARYQVPTRFEAVAGARIAWSAAIAQSVEHVI